MVFYSQMEGKDEKGEIIMYQWKNKKNWKNTLRFAIASATFGMVFGFGVLTYSKEGIQKPVTEVEAATQATIEDNKEKDQERAAEAMAASISQTDLSKVKGNVIDVSNIVEAAMPSVVAVNCVTYVQGSNLYYGFYPYGNNAVKEQNSCGTGIIIGESNENLMVLTNNHVIEDTDKVSIVFSDGAEVEGSVLGSDADADIAIVLVPLANISAETRSTIKIATLGDSDGVRVGEAAIAIGNALGYGQSVTTGVISAVSRDVKLTDKTMTLIQTDAAINGGNSGGPLLNASGEVIGINTVKYAASGVEGMGYAIPITNAKPIIQNIIDGSNKSGQEQGEAMFGIYGFDVPEQHQRMYQMPEGVFVYGVLEGSPAQKYNINPGSIITAIDGKAIANMEALTATLQEHQPGDTINVTLMVPRNSQYTEETIQVVLAAR